MMYMTGRTALPKLIALCSTDMNRPMLSTLVVLGGTSIIGSLITVNEWAARSRFGLGSGARRVVLPASPTNDLTKVSADLLGCFNLIFCQNLRDVVHKALGME